MGGMLAAFVFLALQDDFCSMQESTQERAEDIPFNKVSKNKMRENTRGAWGPLILSVSMMAAAGCATKTVDDTVLAEVGDERIDLAEFEAFSESIPDGMKQGDTSLQRARSTLETLIDKKVLLSQARALELENEPAIKRKFSEQLNKALAESYQRHHAMAGISVSREEREAHFHATDRDRALRFGGIMLEAREQALEVIEQLRDGADFDQLASERSFHRETGERGGDSGAYMRKDELRPAIAERIFGLEVGELSEPVAMAFQGRRRYVVFKIIDEIPVVLEEVEELIHMEVLGGKVAARQRSKLDSLVRVYSPQINYENLPVLRQRIEAVADADWSQLEAHVELVLGTHAGGEFTLGDLLGKLEVMHINHNDLADSARVVGILNHLVIPAQIAVNEARKLGLQGDPALLAEVQRQKEKFLLSQLREREVDQHIDASEEEARAFYDAHPDKFTSPETTTIAEILVHAESVAQRLRRELEDGASPDSLVLLYSTRTENKHHGGKIELNLYSKPFFPEMYSVAATLDVGDVGGPIALANGYSVFKILSREQKLLPYDDDSRRRSIAYVRIDRARHGYVSWVRGLRQSYPVKIYQERLEKAVGADPLSDR